MKSFGTVLSLFTVLLACSITNGQPSEDSLRQVTVLYTNDEHGWMEGMSPDQGAANLYRLWQDQEGYTEDGPFLVLSGGDNFTGPAISTWVQGESMVEVMNAMHYAASAVGNHEYDFGLETLTQRTRESYYPYLSANTRWRENGEVPADLGIYPYTLVTVNGLDIGIIGLTTTSTPYVTNPVIVRDLVFEDYEPVLRETVGELSAAAPDMVFVIAHVCMEELETLAAKIADLDIALLGGGHCNELFAEEIGDTVVLEGGYHYTAYAKATFVYDLERRRIVSRQYGTNRNRGSNPDSRIADIVSNWAESASDILGEVVGWNAERIVTDGTLEQLIIDSWLDSYPAADIAITNRGGVRASMEAGEITFSDVFNILPFDNTIISVEVPGQVVTEALEQGGGPVVAGLEKRGGRWMFTRSNEALQSDRTYTVLLNSFMYDGGNNFGAFAKADPEGFDTAMNYRQPFVDWLKQQKTTRENPLSF